MAISPKSKGLGNIGNVVNRQGLASPVKPQPAMAKPVKVNTKIAPARPQTVVAKQPSKPNPFTAAKNTVPPSRVNPMVVPEQAQRSMMPQPGMDTAPIQAQQRNPFTGVTAPSQPKTMMPAPGKTNPMVAAEQKPISGLNQTQQDYFKYANAQRAIEQQNQQASDARWSARQKAINDAGYGTGSGPYGYYDTAKDASALQFINDWDAANPYNNQSYDQNYADFNAYAQKNLGFNPNDPNNPNSVNGFANYDMGLFEVRRPNNSMLNYMNPVEGYQDKQGNYYDMSGNPMAAPSWATTSQPGQAVPKTNYNMFDNMFGGGGQPGDGMNNMPKYDMPNTPIFGGQPEYGDSNLYFDDQGRLQGHSTFINDKPSLGQRVELPRFDLSKFFGGQPGQGYINQGEMNMGGPVIERDYMPNPNPGFGGFFGEYTSQPGRGAIEAGQQGLGQMFNQQSPLQTAFNPTGTNNSSGSLFGGGGFAGT